MSSVENMEDHTNVINSKEVHARKRNTVAIKNTTISKIKKKEIKIVQDICLVSAPITNKCSVLLPKLSGIGTKGHTTKDSVKRQISNFTKSDMIEDFFGTSSSENRPPTVSTFEEPSVSGEPVQISDSKKNNLNQFSQSVEYILKCAEENCISQFSNEPMDAGEFILNHHILHDLYISTMNLKSIDAMHLVSTDRITMLLNVLKAEMRTFDEEFIQHKVPIIDDHMFGAANACLVCLYIMTSSNMPKRIYLEEVIDKTINFIKIFVNNTNLAAQVTDVGSKNKLSVKSKKRAKSFEDTCLKMSELLNALTDLLQIIPIREDVIPDVCFIGISTVFYHGNSKLATDGTRLLKTVFARYSAYRRTLLEEILSHHGRNFVTKITMKIYPINDGEYIQHFTAIILQLLQTAVASYDQFTKKIEDDKLICDELDNITACGAVFLTTFLNKCYGKSNDIDYKSMFVNFLQDLVICLDKPEWPVVGLLLSLVGKLLLKNSTSENPSQQRLLNLDYFGIIAVKFYIDYIKREQQDLEPIIKKISLMEDNGTNLSILQDKLVSVNAAEKSTALLQMALLDFLSVYSKVNGNQIHDAVYFYIAQWHKKHLNDAAFVRPAPVEKNTKNTCKLKKRKQNIKVEQHKNQSIALYKLKQLKEMPDTNNKSVPPVLDYPSAAIVANYLATKDSFWLNFEHYLKVILFTMNDSCIHVRTKALKCLDSLIEIDVALLKRPDVESAVCRSLLDSSALTRESAVDLVGKLILSNSEMLVKLYESVSGRILDNSVGVRKKVIKLLKEFCIKCTSSTQISDAILKIINRITDEEESVQRLVIESIRDIWFEPSKGTMLQKKVSMIVNVLSVAGTDNLHYAVKVFCKILGVKSGNNLSVSCDERILTAWHQIFNLLSENIMKLEEPNTSNLSQHAPSIATLYVFTQVTSQPVVPYITKLKNYFTFTCRSKEHIQVISYVVNILHLAISHVNPVDNAFLRSLEFDLIRLSQQYDRSMVSSCVACLGLIVNKYTGNFSIIQECFKHYYDYLLTFKYWLESSCISATRDVHKCQYFKRGMFTIGQLFLYFDFEDPNVGNLSVNIKDEVYQALIYFIENGDEDIQMTALNTLGSLCIRHCKFLQDTKLLSIYHNVLVNANTLAKIKIEVILNIELFLQEDENREVKTGTQTDNSLKTSDSFSQTGYIMQIYFKDILSCYINPDVQVRFAAARLIGRVMNQGIVHPIQAVPYLICMCSDPDTSVSDNAFKVLTEIKIKYPTFVHTRSYVGLKLSYKLQTLLQKDILVRGYRIEEGENLPVALNANLYTLLRNTKHSRHALLLYMLSEFDKQDTSLSYMLYLSDNLAYFHFVFQEEPMFIAHQIDTIVSLIGANVIHTFGKFARKKSSHNSKCENKGSACLQDSMTDGEDEDTTLLECLPEDASTLQPCVIRMHACMLLLCLKNYLKAAYGISDLNIQQYSSTEPTKLTEKNINRKERVYFKPSAFLKAIQEEPLPEILDETKRSALIKQVKSFKKMMMQFDKHPLE